MEIGFDMVDEKKLQESYNQYRRHIAPYDEIKKSMTCQEAVELAKCAEEYLPRTQVNGNDWDLHIYSMHVAVGKAIEALEMQLPKKPMDDEYSHPCCPNCGWIVYQDEWGGRYLPHCENCGQAIDWAETME